MGDGHKFRGTARYEIVRLLGEGGMGSVYEAFDREAEISIALKVLRKIDPQLRLRFKREFRAVQGLQHRNLVRLGELVDEAGTLFYTMELVRGVDFLSYVRLVPDSDGSAGGPPTRDLRRPAHATPATPRPAVSSEIGFDERKLRGALVDLAHGLAALHEDDKLHRDVKPSNVLVEPGGRAVLLDFGLVLPATEIRITSAGGAMGTAVYMAPEQALEQPLTPTADWYSVGVMLYEALTGRVPFDGSEFDVMMAKQGAPPDPPRSLVPDVPADLDALCVALLHTEPDRRPPTAEILRRLDADPQRARASDQSRLRRATTATAATPFVGRDRELDTLRAAYDAAASAAVVVVIDGQSGVGKSELARQFTLRLGDDASPPLVLAGRCYERESIPYKALDGVVDALSSYLGDLDPDAVASVLPARSGLLRQVFPVLRRVESIAASPAPHRAVADPGRQREDTFSTLRELFVRLAACRRVVLLIDDLQWTDSDSLALLGALVRPPDPPPLLIVATVRSRQPGVLPSDLRASLSAVAGGPRQLSLGRLTKAAATELAASVVPAFRDEASGTVRAIVTEAGGHPMFLLELLRYMQTNPGKGLSIRLDDALWLRVLELSAEARAMLETVCVAGTPLAQSVVAQAARQDGATWARCVSELRAAHFARTAGDRPSDSIEPYHDRVREAVTAHLRDEQQQRIHQQLAMALEGAGAAEANPHALVRHLVAIGDFDRAARNAERAALVASRALAFDRAVELYEAVVDLAEPSYGRAELSRVRVALAEALANAGRAAEAGDAFITAADATEELEVELNCRRRAASEYLICGQLERGRETIASVLRRFDIAFPATPRRALVSLLWSRSTLRLRGRRWKEKREQDIPADQMARFDVLRAIAQGLGPVDSIRAAAFQGRATLLALRMGEPRRVAAALGYEAVFYGMEGGRSLHAARAILDEARSIAERFDDPYLTGWLGMSESMICFTEGDFLAAAGLLARAEGLLEHEPGATWEVNQARIFRLQNMRFMGQFKALRPEFARLSRIATQRGDRYTETSLNRSYSFLSLVDDDPARADEVRKAATWAPPADGFHLQHLYDLRARSEICLYDGSVVEHLDELRADYDALARSLLPRIQITRLLSLWTCGRVLLAAAVATGDETHAAEAKRLARKMARETTPYAGVWGGLLAAGIARHTDGAEASRPILARVVAQADEHHMDLMAAAARRRLGVLIGGDEGDALIARADEWMRAETIKHPERMTHAICPGF